MRPRETLLERVTVALVMIAVLVAVALLPGCGVGGPDEVSALDVPPAQCCYPQPCTCPKEGQ